MKSSESKIHIIEENDESSSIRNEDQKNEARALDPIEKTKKKKPGRHAKKKPHYNLPSTSNKSTGPLLPITINKQTRQKKTSVSFSNNNSTRKTTKINQNIENNVINQQQPLSSDTFMAVSGPTAQMSASALNFFTKSLSPQIKRSYTNNNKTLQQCIYASPVNITSVFLELLLNQQSIIHQYFDICESMLCKNSASKSLDELYYTWITRGKKPLYNEMFSLEEQQDRLKKLNLFLENKKKKHFEASVRLFNSGFLNDEIISFSDLPTTPSIRHDDFQKTFSPIKYDKKILNNDLDTTWIAAWIKQDQKKNDIASSQTNSSSFIESLTSIDSIQFLTSSVVNTSCLILWCPREVVLFELALCHYGQNFMTIGSIIKTKTYKDCYTFYVEIFKQTNRYKLFKEFKSFASWYTA